MADWSSVVESMSTLELCSVLREAEAEPGNASPRMLEHVAREWTDRPARDRLAAEALLAAAEAEVRP